MAERVPTADELVGMGFAERDRMVPKGSLSRIKVSDEGHALMGAAMRRNAQAALARGEGHWEQPPSVATKWWTEPHWTDGTPVDDYERKAEA